MAFRNPVTCPEPRRLASRRSSSTSRKDKEWHHHQDGHQASNRAGLLRPLPWALSARLLAVRTGSAILQGMLQVGKHAMTQRSNTQTSPLMGTSLLVLPLADKLGSSMANKVMVTWL